MHRYSFFITTIYVCTSVYYIEYVVVEKSVNSIATLWLGYIVFSIEYVDKTAAQNIVSKYVDFPKKEKVP